MTGNERLARAVLLFFRGGPWTDNDRAVWESMTGYPTPTAATLCEFAREVLSDERMRSQGLHVARITADAAPARGLADLDNHLGADRAVAAAGP